MFLNVILFRIQYMLLISSIFCVAQDFPGKEAITLQCDLDKDFIGSYIGVMLSPIDSEDGNHLLRVVWNHNGFVPGDRISVFSFRAKTGVQEIYTFKPSNGNGWKDTGIETDFEKPLRSVGVKQCHTYYVAWLRQGIIHSINCIKSEPTWMADRKAALSSLALKDLFIPGTHNSGSYNIDPSYSMDNFVRKLTITQDMNIFEQLILGVRYLDIRVGCYPDNDVSKWWVNHGRIRMVPLATVLEDISRFLDLTNEFVILDIQEFPIGFDDGNIYKDLSSYLTIKLGKYLAPTSFNWTTPLSTLWSNESGRLFLNFDLPVEQHSLPMRQGSIRQFWMGTDDSEELQQYLRSVEHLVESNATTLKASMAELTLSMFSTELYFSKGIRTLADSLNPKITIWYHKNWSFLANIVAVDFLRSSGIIDIAIKANDWKFPRIIERKPNCVYPSESLTSASLLEFMNRTDVRNVLVPSIANDAVLQMYQIMFQE